MEIDNIYNCDCLEGMSELPTGHKYCIVTDPPFNVGYHYNEYKDNKSEDEYFEWLEQITKGYPVVMIHYPEALYKFAFQIGQFPERVASWVYNSNTPRQHRDIAYFGIKPDFTLMHQPYKNPTDKRIAKRIAEGHEGGMLYDWWEINQVKNVSKEKHGVTHPCQMPVEVMQRVVGIIDPKRRLGCMCCPLAFYKKRIEQFKEHPNMVKAYIRAGQKFRDTHPYAKSIKTHPTVYQQFVRDVFFERQKAFEEHTSVGLFAEHIDYKQFLMDYFGIHL